jgi:thioesterase domain-containing protein/acyl carrier protein
VGVSIGQEISILPTGEIAVRGPGLFRGYDCADGQGEGAFCGDWYRTGDLGYLDEDGYLFLTGRLGNVINRGGEKISPEEVEEVLRRHPALRDAVVFAVPHEVLGQDAAALIVPRTPGPDTGIDLSDIRRFIAQHLAVFKVPRAMVVVDSIPSGPTGKVQRSELGALFGEKLTRATRGHAGDPPRTQIERQLAEIWTRLLGLDQVGIRDRFLDLGGNSLLAVNMLTEVERKFGRSIPMASFWHSPVIEHLAQVLIEADYKKLSVLLPVYTGGAKPPLFIVMPGWFVSEAELMSRHLGPDQPVYALIPDVRPGAGQSGLTREEVVAECVAAVEDVQESGPYCVIGRSIGGSVAVDIACALRSRGKTVALLALLDTHYPGVTRTGLLPTPLRQMEFLIGEFVQLPRAEWAGHLRDLPVRAARVAWRKLRRSYLPSQIANASLYTGLQRVFDEPPRPWAGRITFFAAEDSKHRGFLDRRLYWSKAAAQGLEVHLVPGDHNMMVQEPHIRELAATLKACLERTCAAEFGRS